MDREDLRNEIRRLLLDTDTTNPRWSDTIINDRIDLSHDRIACLTKCIESRITDGIDLGVSEYALPSYFLEIKNVQILGNGSTEWIAIDKITEEELDNANHGWRNLPGEPQKFYQRRNNIGLYPEPDYTQTNSLRIDIYRRPDAFTSDTDIPFEGVTSLYPFHMAIAYDVARMCSLDDVNVNKITVFTAEVDKLTRQILYQLATQAEETRIPNIYEKSRSQARRTC
jgi:hypothetical protein